MKIKEVETKEETQQKYWEVDVLNIKPLNRAGGNIRTDYGDKDNSFQELVDSIRENGIKVPIRGYRDADNNGQWFSIDGHRRLAAATKLVNEEGLSIKVRVIVVDARKISDEEIIYDMVTTNSGKPLNPIEMSEAVRRLENYGIPLKDIAKRFGKATTFVNNLSYFAKAPKRLRDLVEKNRVSYSLVIETLRDSKDFNDASEKIEAALNVAKQVAKQKSFNPETDTEDLEYKASKRHLNAATNKLDSMKELQRVIREYTDKNLIITNQELFNFANAIAKNQVTAKEIEKLIFQPNLKNK